MSAKARLWRLLTLAYGWLVASPPAPRAAAFERQEPNLGGRAAPSLAPQAEEDFEEDDEEEEVPAARAPRKKAARPRAVAQIIRPVRTAADFRADRAEGVGSPAAQQVGARIPTRARWKACSAISASAARSSRPIPVRW